MRVLRYALALLAAGAGIGADASPLEGDLVWNNLAKAGRATEVRVSFQANPADHISVSLRHGGAVRRYTLDARSGAYSLPVVIESAAPIEIEIHSDGERLGAATVVPRQISGTLVVSNLPAAALERLSADYLVVADTAQFPRSPAGYGPVDLVVLDAAKMTGLSALQRAALRAHMDMCGRTIITADAGPDWAAAAGCTDAHLQLGEPGAAPQELADAARSVLSRRTQTLPDADAVAELNPTEQTHAVWLFAPGLALYIGIVLLAARRRNKNAWLAAIPIAVCAVIIFAPLGSRETGRYTWGEMTSGDNQYRYVSVTTVTGNRRGNVQLDMPAASMPWRARSQGGDYLVELYGADGRAGIESSTLLMQRRVFAAGGVREIEPGLTFETSTPKPIIKNTGAATSVRAELAWAGSKYAVPALAPGAVWTPEDRYSLPWSDAPRDRMFRRRTASTPAALLLERDGFAGEQVTVLIRP